MIEIRNRWGKVVAKVEAKSLAEAVTKLCAEARARGERADLSWANFEGADLSWANFEGADLSWANLSEADLSWANLSEADLSWANFEGADLSWANLSEADLSWANLTGSTMPDGRVYEAYRLDPLAGICDEPEARKRAIGAWGYHQWTDCPMHAAHGYKSIGDAPEAQRRDVAAFVALFDAGLLPAPNDNDAPPSAPEVGELLL